MKILPSDSISACITDPPYNYEFIGHKWDNSEIQRRISKAKSKDSKTLVKNIPYGSGLAGGVRNERWYQRNRENILDYEKWCLEWGMELYRICKPGATVFIFNSTRTSAYTFTPSNSSSAKSYNARNFSNFSSLAAQNPRPLASNIRPTIFRKASGLA